jgi:hypothetical protein
MRSDLVTYLAVGVPLILLIFLPRWLWHRGQTAPPVPKRTQVKREPKSFAGYIHKPECELCDQDIDAQPQGAPGAPPPRMTFTRGRHRQVDTTGHCCPHATCLYHGWVGFGNIRANGHPNGRRWRQLHCQSCHGYFWSPMARHFTANRSISTNWYGLSQL